VAISFCLHRELDVLMDPVQVVKEFSQLVGSIWPHDKRVRNETSRILSCLTFALYIYLSLLLRTVPPLCHWPIGPLPHLSPPIPYGQPSPLRLLYNLLSFRTRSLIALMIEAVCNSETSVSIYLTTRQCLPEDSKPHTRRHENLKSHIGAGK
jgi:hypothetical protein